MTNSTNYLDLDSVAPAKKSVRIFGTEYEMRPMSLRDFAQATREQAAFEKKLAAGEADEVDQIEHMLKSMKRILPSITEEHVGKLTMDQLVAITSFAQATAEAGAPQAAEGGEGNEQKAES